MLIRMRMESSDPYDLVRVVPVSDCFDGGCYSKGDGKSCMCSARGGNFVLLENTNTSTSTSTWKVGRHLAYCIHHSLGGDGISLVQLVQEIFTPTRRRDKNLVLLQKVSDSSFSFGMGDSIH